MAAWIGVTIASRTLPGGGTTPQRLRRIFASTTFWLAFGVPYNCFRWRWPRFAQYGSAAEEPLAFFSGISIWPTEMLRLIVFMLAIQFMVKAGIDLRANERKLTDAFRFRSIAVETRFRWADLGIGLEQWRITRSKESRPKPEFSAEEAWHAYLRRNKFWPRFIRIGILVDVVFRIRRYFDLAFPACASSSPRRTRLPVRSGGHFPGGDWHDDSLFLRRRCHPVEQ